MGKVTRANAAAFCQRLNRMERRKNRIPRNYEYRLPTEAEWEYCCRADQPPSEEVNGKAWHAGNSGDKVNKIGSKTPNAWGLHDMRGNVSEWCLDSFSGNVYSNRKSGAADPVYLSKGTFYSIRGGDFKSPTNMCQPHARGKMAKTATAPQVGFRVILAPVQSELNAN
jgi:formylglycine-generating enzyme required for sulfatase activity